MSADTESSVIRPRDRREAPDRRRRLLHSIFIGGLTPRRHAHRRDDVPVNPALDWHDARWLVVAATIMLLSAADAFLTLQLLELGANEANPVMAHLLEGGSAVFGLTKVLLTAAGVVILALMARFRAFGRIPVGLVLYFVLALYGALIAYECWLLGFLQRPG
jgi:hypothetical protein